MQPVEVICKECKKLVGVVDSDSLERTNEVTSSPLESVVQGRPESPVPSNPAVQGTPDILAELRARAIKVNEKAKAVVFSHNFFSKKDTQYAIDHTYMTLSAEFIKWLDDLTQPSDNTAPDTTSGSAGVP